MPRGKPKTPSASAGSPAAVVNGVGGEVLTLREAAGYLRLPETEVLRLVQDQGLPARQAGEGWRFLKAAVQDWLRTGPASRSNKEAWMALAGAWKDDPSLDELRREIARQRERLQAEVER
jgi:excisionase family DNA binding protein